MSILVVPTSRNRVFARLVRRVLWARGMRNGNPARSPCVQVLHEALDAYWFAELLRYRALEIVTEAKCKATIGRRLETVLDRLIRLIAEAADDSPEKANARLARARAAIGLALVYFNELALKRGVREAVIADLREHTGLLLERLQMLEGKPQETWPASNCLPTVLEEIGNGVPGSNVNTLEALAKVPEAAVRDLPRPVVGAAGQALMYPDDLRAAVLGGDDDDPTPTPATS